MLKETQIFFHFLKKKKQKNPKPGRGQGAPQLAVVLCLSPGRADGSPQFVLARRLDCRSELGHKNHLCR